MSRSTARPRVVIVGAGLAGTATAIRLLCFAREPLEIVLLERRPDYRHAGVAYHRDGNPWGHVFNIQAGRMSVFRENVLDFVRWANREADRRDWPQPWAELEFTEHGPAPRRILQDYLADRLAEARREARDGVVLVEMDGEALDLEIRPDGVTVSVRLPSASDPDDGQEGGEAGTATAPTTLSATHVILATGLELRDPPFAAKVHGHPAYLRNPYSAHAVRTLERLPSEATVAIVGSVLSAYDSTAFLLRRGHTGTIHLISRSGTVFRTYPRGHEHGVVRLPRPEALLEPYRDRAEFLARIRGAWQEACATVLSQHPEIAPEVVAERVAKAWEPYLPEAMENLPTAELKALLNDYSTPIAALRVNAVEYTMVLIEQAMRPADGAEGSVRLVIGAVEEIAPTDSARLLVSVGAPGQARVIEADLVVSNFARETDYSRVKARLWRNLLRRGLAVPHERTGRGVQVDRHGVLLGPAGEPAGRVCAVGVPREGDEIVRNGRTGAFAFNLAAIKNQSITVAAHVVEQLELHDESLAAHLDAPRADLGNIEQADEGEFDQAVSLEVRRLATRNRGERESLDLQLDARIKAASEPCRLPLDASRLDRLTRAAVSRAAVARLTDVSVTPRQLRRQLGLANPDDPED